jgi:hypothetical protein
VERSWTHVRELVGCLRFDMSSPIEPEAVWAPLSKAASSPRLQ